MPPPRAPTNFAVALLVLFDIYLLNRMLGSGGQDKARGRAASCIRLRRARLSMLSHTRLQLLHSHFSVPERKLPSQRGTCRWQQGLTACQSCRHARADRGVGHRLPACRSTGWGGCLVQQSRGGRHLYSRSSQLAHLNSSAPPLTPANPAAQAFVVPSPSSTRLSRYRRAFRAQQ